MINSMILVSVLLLAGLIFTYNAYRKKKQDVIELRKINEDLIEKLKNK